MTVEVRPLHPDDWSAFVDLVTDMRDIGCWCMYWRIGAEYRKRPADDNREAMERVVLDGPPPGLLAFMSDKAVGWCQVTPRDDLTALDTFWRLRPAVPEVDPKLWAISCLYVRKGHRRQGVTGTLIKAAVEYARSHGAQVVEAYPFDAAVSPSASDTGYASSFEKAGFEVVERRVPARPIMRLVLE